MLESNPLYSHIKLPDNRTFSVTDYKRKNISEWVINNHFHNIYEIVLYIEIKGSASLNNDKIDIDSFKLLYIPPYTVHGFTLPKQDCEYIVLHTSHSFLLDLPQYPVLWDLKDKNMEVIQQLLLWCDDSEYSEEFKMDSVKMILSWISEERGVSTKTFNKNSLYFTPLLKYINENKIYTLSTDQASSICNMSRSSFLSHFKRYFKISFHSFLLERRIDEAKYLLTNTTMNCVEIATQLGFSDASHFTKVFKKITNTLPKNFNINS